ncbi:hypothetical protein [Nostoc sp. C117]|uniref:hypothetical protein n=1 Tax=Nostoc sp. C117 TaxID=3349875 RepID=UPI00370D14EB
MSTIQVIFIAFILISAMVAWWKAGFRCPLYIHVIAGLATALGFFITNNIDPSTPVNQWWLFGK